MLAQLGPKRALDQRLFQLFEQPVLSGQILGLRVVRKQFVQKFGGNRRISRHVSLPLKVNSQKPTYTLFLTPSSVCPMTRVQEAQNTRLMWHCIGRMLPFGA